jgi:hypothetical protein
LVFPQVLASVQREVELREISTQSAWVGGLLRANGDGSSNDRIAVRLEQVIRIHRFPVTPEVLGAEQLTLTPSLRSEGGVNLLQFTLNAAAPTFIQYPERYLATVIKSAEIASQLGAQFPERFARTLNDSLRPLVDDVVVDFQGLCNPLGQNPAMDCQQAIQSNPTSNRLFGAFSATCVPFAELTSDEQMKRAQAYCSARSNNRPLERIGFCAVRLSPTRVQVLPEGLQIVLADDENDPRLPALRLIVPLARNFVRGIRFIASCDDARQREIYTRTAYRTLRTLAESIDTTGEGTPQICDARGTGRGSCAQVIARAVPPALPSCN